MTRRIALAGCLAAACAPAAAPSEERPPGTSLADAGAAASEAIGCDQLDVLLVVDTTYTMTEEQANLAANLPAFVAALERLTGPAGQPLDYHLGVATGEVSARFTQDSDTGPVAWDLPGDDGALQRGDCAMERAWVERGDTDAAASLACAARVGADGQPMQMPLQAARLALSAPRVGGANAGFRRPDAHLGLIVVTGHDDCSRSANDFVAGFTAFPPFLQIETMCFTADPVETHVAAFDAIAGGRDRWSAAVVAAIDGACTGDFGLSYPAPRLAAFADAGGENLAASSICPGDLGAPLAAALAGLRAACDAGPVE